MKQLFAIVLTLVLTIGGAAQVQASSNPAVRREAQVAGNYLARAIEIIMTHYMYTVTVDGLMEAAVRGMTKAIGIDISVEARLAPIIGNEVEPVNSRLAEAIELIKTQHTGSVTACELFDAAMRSITATLDRYSYYMSAPEYKCFIDGMTGNKVASLGIVVTTTEEGHQVVYDVLSDSLAQIVGIKPGDVFLFVNWKYVTGLYHDVIADRLFSTENDHANIIVGRGGCFYIFDISTAKMYCRKVIVERLEYMPVAQEFSNLCDVRYMHIRRIGCSTGYRVGQALSDMQQEGVTRLILNLRGNGGGYLCVTVDISNKLVPQGTIAQTLNKSGNRHTYTSTLQESLFEYIVVLVDRYTASGAEIIASALQDSGAAVIIGETTFGKGLVQSIYPVGFDSALVITTKEYFRRDGGRINEIGVIPCIEIGEFQICKNWDAVLHRALELLAGR